MKRFFKILSVCSIAAAIGAASAIPASAAGINPAEQKILDELHTSVTMAGYPKYLPVVYINQTENYLNTVELTEADKDAIIAGINETKAYLTSTGAPNYDGLTDAQIDEFFSYCQKTVAPINLKIAYDKPTRVVSIIDDDGKVIYSTQIGSKKDIIDPNPIKQTGFDFNLPGVTAVAGVGILFVSAAGIYLVRSKKKAASENA